MKRLHHLLPQDTEGRINSLDFHRVEDVLVTAGDDDSIRTYNTQTGTAHKVLFSKKYGVSHISFTHDPQSVIYASNKVSAVQEAALYMSPASYVRPLSTPCHLQGSDHKIRYQTLHDNKYVRYFRGHTQQVTGLCLSPKNDMFISAGEVRNFLYRLLATLDETCFKSSIVIMSVQ